jgi:hypothetical protein
MNITREEKLCLLEAVRDKVEELTRKELSTHIILLDSKDLAPDVRLRVAKTHENARKSLDLTKRALNKLIATPAIG